MTFGEVVRSVMNYVHVNGDEMKLKVRDLVNESLAEFMNMREWSKLYFSKTITLDGSGEYSISSLLDDPPSPTYGFDNTATTSDENNTDDAILFISGDLDNASLVGSWEIEVTTGLALTVRQDLADIKVIPAVATRDTEYAIVSGVTFNINGGTGALTLGDKWYFNIIEQDIDPNLPASQLPKFYSESKLFILDTGQFYNKQNYMFYLTMQSKTGLWAVNGDSLYIDGTSGDIEFFYQSMGITDYPITDNDAEPSILIEYFYAIKQFAIWKYSVMIGDTEMITLEQNRLKSIIDDLAKKENRTNQEGQFANFNR